MADSPTPAAPSPTPTDPATPEPVAPPQPDPATGDELGDGKGSERAVLADLAKERKERQRLSKELETVRQQNMSEADKAVAEAEKRGAATATAAMTQRLVRSDFIAAASRINPEYDATAVLDDLNLAKFVGEDGEPDTAEIKKAAERLFPVGNRVPSFDGGVRTNAPPSGGSFSDQLRSEMLRKGR